MLFAAADPEGRPLRIEARGLVLDTAGARGHRATTRGDDAGDLAEEEEEEEDDAQKRRKGKGKQRRTTDAGSSRPQEEAAARAASQSR